MGVLVSHTVLLQAADAASDAELVARASKAIAGAARCSTAATPTYLLAIAARLLGNRGEAEEVVQDTFVTAFEQLRDAARAGGAARLAGADRGQPGAPPHLRRGRLMRVLGLDHGADDATLAALAAPARTPISAPSWRWSTARSATCVRTCASPGCSGWWRDWS